MPQWKDARRVYANTEGLCCAPETNTTSYSNYTSIIKNSNNNNNLQGS